MGVYAMRSDICLQVICAHNHHHLICKSCGKVTPFEDDLLEELEAHIEQDAGFHVMDTRIKILRYL